MKPRAGFTLIELLVVISIIALLSSVVLSSLSSARTKSKETAIKSDLRTARIQAQMYFSNNGTYGTYQNDCAPVSASVFSDSVLRNALSHAVSITGTTLSLGSQCNAYDTSFVIAVKMPSGLYWCVDSSGASKQFTGTPSNSTTSC